MSLTSAVGAVVVRVQDRLELLDRAGVVGIGLLVCAAAMLMSTVLPAQDALRDLQARDSRSEKSERSAKPVVPGAEQLKQFFGHFPPVTEAADWVARVHAIGERNGLVLDTGEYRMSHDKDLGMARYQITLPVKGEYAKVRRFTIQVLDEIPAAALDEVTFRRDEVGAKSIETRVRLSLYLVDNR